MSKYNPDKLRWRNFPLWLIEPLIHVASFGEDKHGMYDFLQEKYTVNDHLDALKRHLMKLEDPNQSDIDDESKKNHAYHIAWRALIAAYVIETYPQSDDRYKGNKKENPIIIVPSGKDIADV